VRFKLLDDYPAAQKVLLGRGDFATGFGEARLVAADVGRVL